MVAHDRVSYVLEALRSVVSQGGFDPRTCELVLVKAFDDVPLEREIGRLGVRIVTCPSVELGSKLVAGIESTDAELISFLEDDDLFGPGKLAGVWSRFHDPALGYYHNSQRLVDSGGGPLPDSGFRSASRRRIARLGRAYIPATRSPTSLDALVGVHPEFNNSCISIRRQILADRLPVLRQIRVAADEFLFFCALASPLALLIDSAPLTAFRLHPANLSVGRKSGGREESERLTQYSSYVIGDLTLLREMLSKEGWNDLLPTIDTIVAVQSTIRALRGVEADPSIIQDSLRVLRSNRGNFEARTFWPVRLLANLYRVSPSVARWVYRALGPGTH